MKKILALILALCMLMSFAACGNNEAPAEPAEPAAPVEPDVVDPGSEPAAPGEGPDMEDMPAVMPEVSGSDLPPVEDVPSTDTDLPVFDADNKPLILLTELWATYADEEKFAAAGGDYENMVMDGPGACGLNDAEALDALFGLPVSEAGNLSAAASLMHMMNANTFTSACYELNEGVDSAAFVEAVKANILSRQWMCGFPETLLILDVDGCIITAFGNGEIVELFKTKLTGETFNGTVLVEEPIA